MPLLFIFAYFLLETLAFYGVAKLIGVGWALVALFITMLFGMAIAMMEVRRLMSQQVVSDGHGGLFIKKKGAGKLAGNVGLTLGGGLLLSAPGFVTTVMGLLMVFPPTRALLRTLVSLKLVRSIESAGVRFYQAANLGKPTTSYGTFTSGTAADQAPEDVIDEDELRQWSENIDPEDFQDGKR